MRRLIPVFVALLAVNGIAWTVSQKPDPVPSPSPSLSGASLEVHTVTVPGQAIPLAMVRIMDATHAWAAFDSCYPTSRDTCERAVASSSDGGKTWHRANLPALSASVTRVDFFPLNANTLSVRAYPQGWLVTTDGGNSFGTRPLQNAPVEAQLVRGTYGIVCKGYDGFQNGVLCPALELVKAGSGPVDPQPPLPLGSDFGTDEDVLSAVYQGGDSRIWLSTQDQAGTHLLVSSDGAKTWQQMPTPPGRITATGVFTSPDGTEIWYLCEDQMARQFIGGQWRQDLRIASPVAIGHETLAGVFGKTFGFATAGQVELHPELGQVTAVSLLPDGTLLAESQDNYLVGTGSGTGRTWYAISRSSS